MSWLGSRFIKFTCHDEGYTVMFRVTLSYYTSMFGIALSCCSVMFNITLFLHLVVLFVSASHCRGGALYIVHGFCHLLSQLQRVTTMHAHMASEQYENHI